MKFFKKRSVALVLCILAVIVSTLVNTRWKLGKQCRALDDMFYSSSGIAGELGTLYAEADKLAAVAEANGIDALSLRGASGYLQGVLSQHSVTAPRLYRYYETLRTELSVMEQKLLSASLSSADAAAVSKSLEAIHGAQTAIGADAYNEQVRAFRTKYNSVFTRVLASMAGLSLPLEFA